MLMLLMQTRLLLMKRSSFIYIFKTTQVKMICTFVYVPRSFMLIFFSWVGALKQICSFFLSQFFIYFVKGPAKSKTCFAILFFFPGLGH
jgi:hypothetical protein